MKKVLKKPLSSPPASGETSNRLRFFTERKDAITETIRQLVEIESPSDNKPAVDELGALLAGRFEKIGGHAKFHRVQNFGDHLQVDFPGPRGGKPVLLLGHMDTVYSMGTLSTMPCRVADGRLWGPGALDMKSGIALILHALEGLRSWHGDSVPRPVTVLLVSDEEVGSASSRRITESLARKSEAVLVLEPAYGIKGALKTARKGVGEYTIRVIGKAAHSGLDFDKGESAIVELAKQITAISKLVDLKRGLTLNVGLVSGGTRANVIPGAGHCFPRCARGAHERRRGHRPPTKIAQAFQSQVQTGNQRRRKPSTHGAGCRRNRALQESLGNRPTTGLEAGRSIRRGRLGRKLYRQSGNPNARRPRRSGGRRPRHARVHNNF